MPPAKKKNNRVQKSRILKNEKLASFIKDFDSQVKNIVEELKASVVKNLKEVDRLYNFEIIKRPVAIREMCWLDFFAKGGSQKALKEAISVNVGMEEITSVVTKTPLKSVKKVKKVKSSESMEDTENIPLKSVVRTKSKAKVAAKRTTATRKNRLSAAQILDTSKRTSKRGRATPSNSRLIDTSVLGYTPAITPKIDARLFKTPGLRTPAMQEPVYTFSANGSPLAGMDEIFLNVPTAEGKPIRLMVNEVDNIDLSRLDKQASENLKMLSSQLEKICKKLK